MIRVQLSDSIIGVGFAYRMRPLTDQENALLKSAEKVLALNNEQLEAVRKDALRNQLKYTKCTLYSLKSIDETFRSNLTVITDVTEPCSDDDIFSKEKGRKAALAHAMKKAGIGKEDRLTVWTAYHGRLRNHQKSETPSV